MLKIEKVKKSFDQKCVLDNVSITVQKGTIHGLIGENGVGKSTLIQCLTGIYKQDEGTITWNDEPIYENASAKAAIGYVADRNQYFKQYRVREMVGLYNELYPTFSLEAFNRYNEVFKLDGRTKVKNLSKGMQMRLSLMLNLARKPELLILDEPTSGLDALAKKQVLDFIIEAVDELQMTVVISSHHLSELERICDEITMLSEGKVLYQSSVDDLKTKVQKLQILFADKAPEDLAKWEEVLNVEQVGSIYYVVTNQYSEELLNKLKVAGATLIETIELNLEEVFIYTTLNQRGRK